MQESFEQILKKKLDQYNLHEYKSLDGIKKEYEELVDTITEGGYSYTIFELDDDLNIRKITDLLISDDDLLKYTIMIDFKSSIEKVDAKLKRFFLPDFIRPHGTYWWEQGILKEAGRSYVETVKMVYGVEVKCSQ